MQRGRWFAKISLMAVVAVILAWVLFALVFPRVDRYLNDPVLSDGAGNGGVRVIQQAGRR